MEISTMGKVVVEAKIQNLVDVHDAERGMIAPDQVRSLTISDAVVDTGATLLSMPARLISQLGLTRLRTRKAKTAAGLHEFGIFDVVRITVQGRECHSEVCEVDENSGVLIGQIPLEGLDFVVDTFGRRLIGNPAHNGEQMVDL